MIKYKKNVNTTTIAVPTTFSTTGSHTKHPEMLPLSFAVRRNNPSIGAAIPILEHAYNQHNR